MLFNSIIFIFVFCLLNLVESQGPLLSRIQLLENENVRTNDANEETDTTFGDSQHNQDDEDFTMATSLQPEPAADEKSTTGQEALLETTTSTKKPSVTTEEALPEATTSTKKPPQPEPTTVQRKPLVTTQETFSGTTMSATKKPSKSNDATITGFHQGTIFQWLFAFAIALHLIV